MDVFVSLAERNMLAFAAILLTSQLVFHETGYRLGVRSNSKASGQTENIGVVVTGMLGLSAFVLALTLSYSTDRFSERREATLIETNAIGTAWLRANAIGSAEGAEIAKLLEEYVGVREDYVGAGRDQAAIDEANKRTASLQTAIWDRVILIVGQRPDAVSASLMAAVNDTFDASTAERFAFEKRLPPQIFWLLIGLTLMSVASLGYQFGLKGNPVRILIVVLTLIWTALIVNILDLASARVGYFRTDLAVYQWTDEGFGQNSQ